MILDFVELYGVGWMWAYWLCLGKSATASWKRSSRFCAIVSRKPRFLGPKSTIAIIGQI